MSCFGEYSELRYLVQCKWNNDRYWETIAAFNVDSVAKDYANEARNVMGKHIEYRCMYRTTDGTLEPLE